MFSVSCHFKCQVIHLDVGVWPHGWEKLPEVRTIKDLWDDTWCIRGDFYMV